MKVAIISLLVIIAMYNATVEAEKKGPGKCMKMKALSSEQMFCELEETLEEIHEGNIAHMENFFPLSQLQEHVKKEGSDFTDCMEFKIKERIANLTAKADNISAVNPQDKKVDNILDEIDEINREALDAKHEFEVLRDGILNAKTYADFGDDLLRRWKKNTVEVMKKAYDLGCLSSFYAGQILSGTKQMASIVKMYSECTEDADDFLDKLPEVMDQLDIKEAIRSDNGITFIQMKRHFLDNLREGLDCFMNDRLGRKGMWEKRIELSREALDNYEYLLKVEKSDLDDLSDEWLIDLGEYFHDLLKMGNNLRCPGACYLINQMYCDMQGMVSKQSYGSIEPDEACNPDDYYDSGSGAKFFNNSTSGYNNTSNSYNTTNTYNTTYSFNSTKPYDG